MSRTNFFQQAPTQDTHQKRFLEAVLNKRHLIASFPLGYPIVSLYALAALVNEGLAVVVCHNSAQIRRNLNYFHQAGLKFPDVAYLDGTQMPHEERQIHQEINRNRVRLLYITPERFISLTFLEVLVHQPITFLAIEEAERLLPDMPGHSLYQKLYEHGLQQLSSPPPMALMVPVMTSARLTALSDHLKLGEHQLIHCPPAIETVELQVKKLFSEHQKFSDLVGFLSDSQGQGSLGRLDEPGSVIIQTAFPVQAEKLSASLSDYGFESVLATHFKKPPREQAKAIEFLNERPNSIVISAGTDIRAWMPPMHVTPKLVFWTPPPNLDSLFMQVFRQPAEKRFLDAKPLKARLYYTKEDFTTALRPFRPEVAGDSREAAEKLQALRKYRHWVLDETCRLQSAAAYLQGTSPYQTDLCGHCDRCLEVHNLRWKLQQTFQNWLY
jgi:ATP-dependent DNA helicase RecQ